MNKGLTIFVWSMCLSGCIEWGDPTPAPVPKPFTVYDATFFADSYHAAGTPQRYDWKKTFVTYTPSHVLPGQTVIDLALTANVAKIISNAPYLAVVTDVEGVWPMSTEKEIWTDANAQAYVLRLLRAQLPKGTKIGCWNRAPLDPSYFGKWGQHMAPVSDAAGEVIAKESDLLFLSLACWTTDANKWEAQARVILTKARRYRKPVIAFVSWQYVGGGDPDENAVTGQKVDLEYWRRVVAVCRELSDGMCLWAGGMGTPDQSLPWTAEDDARAEIVNKAVKP